jgi:hypothetical protein
MYLLRQHVSKQQSTQCKFNLIVTRLRATIVDVDKQKLLWSVFSFGYPACIEHEPYCHLWPVRLYIIFPHYLIKGKIVEKSS